MTLAQSSTVNFLVAMHARTDQRGNVAKCNLSTGDLCLQGAPNTASWSVSLMTTDFTFASNACIPAVARSSTPARGLQGHIGSQWRTPGQASTSLDTLSNISGRLTLCGGHTCVKPSQKQWNNHSLKAGDSTDCAKVTPANSRAYFLERVLRVGDRTKDMYSHAPLNISVANNVTRREPIAFFADNLHARGRETSTRPERLPKWVVATTWTTQLGARGGRGGYVLQQYTHNLVFAVVARCFKFEFIVPASGWW